MDLLELLLIGDLAAAIEYLYGHVAYVGIDIDPELKYPKGAARVVFSKSESLMAAISGKYVHLPHSEVQKRVSSCFANRLQG